MTKQNLLDQLEEWFRKQSLIIVNDDGQIWVHLSHTILIVQSDTYNEECLKYLISVHDDKGWLCNFFVYKDEIVYEDRYKTKYVKDRLPLHWKVCQDLRKAKWFIKWLAKKAQKYDAETFRRIVFGFIHLL